jgi:hypothetical protein
VRAALPTNDGPGTEPCASQELEQDAVEFRAADRSVPVKPGMVWTYAGWADYSRQVVSAEAVMRARVAGGCCRLEFRSSKFSMCTATRNV